MSQKFTVEIPEILLLILASRGNMGDDEIPRMMQLWAEGECKRLGLAEKVLQEKARNYAEIKARVSAIIGSDTIEEVEKRVSVIASAITAVDERAKTSKK
jgi:hypothetical protein